MIKKIILAVTMYVTAHVSAQQVNIIPRPQKVTVGKGSFTINASTVIVSEGSGLETSVSFLNDYLSKYYGLRLKTAATNSTKSNAIVLNYERMDNLIPGAYRM